MILVKYLLPILALPIGERATPFVNAHSFRGGAPFAVIKLIQVQGRGTTLL